MISANNSRFRSRSLLRDISVWSFKFVLPFSLVVGVLFFDFRGWQEFFINVVISAMIGEIVFIFSVSMGRLVSACELKYFQSKNQAIPKRSDLFYGIRSLVFLVPGLYLAFNATYVVMNRVGIRYEVPTFADYKNGLVIGIVAMSVWVLYELYLGKQESEKRIQQLEKDHLQAKISALSAQMNPHLLFNALNTVAATIHENPEAAEEMTVELAGLYRKTLEATKTDFHSLANELALVKAYLTIEKARFGERLDFAIDQGSLDAESLHIPSLVLQPMVENAVKHGIAPLSSGGKVTVTVQKNQESLLLEVHDTGKGFGKSPTSGTGTGLENCRSRLALLFPNEASLSVKCSEENGSLVSICLPLRGEHQV